MHPVRLRRFLRRASAFGTLAALIALISVSLTQCRMVNVDDSVSGAGVLTRSAAQCITECNRVANNLIREESEFHVRQVHQCNDDPVCLGNEEVRHVQAVERIQAGRRACQEGCHHQGGGGGGR